MSCCIVVNVTGCDGWHERTLLAGVIEIPRGNWPSVIHHTRELAEAEAVRLACKTGHRFAVFELSGIVRGRDLSDHERVRGLGPYGARVPVWQELVELP